MYSITILYSLIRRIKRRPQTLCKQAHGENMEFGKFLAKLRKERGILQKELAAYLNTTVSTISNYENGVHTPDLNTLMKLADFYDVSTDYLLQRTRYKANLSTLNKRLSADYTISDLMNTTLELDRHNVNALLDYFELLTMRNTMQHAKAKLPPVYENFTQTPDSVH